MPLTRVQPATASRTGPRRRWAIYLAVFGPGLVVMLADTDVGSLITAGQSGATWGYRLLLLQLVLMPVLYIVQELTVRLGLHTGRGHGELIAESFGRFWAWVSVSGLAIAVMGALITELSGVAGVGEMFGIPRAASLIVAAAMLIGIVFTGSYRRVELVAIVLGLFELAVFVVAWWAAPDLGALTRGMVSIPWTDRSYIYLVAANIGAVIMPWMVFYQQSAVADKKLGPQHVRAARIDTAVGSVVTQLVMAAMLVAVAATLGRTGHGGPEGGLSTVSELGAILVPLLGSGAARLVFALGLLGAGMVASIVATLALAWGVGEVIGYRRSLDLHPREARAFYLVYSVGVAACALLVLFWPDLVALSVQVQIVNALLLPFVLGFLVALARKSLPPALRLRGWYYAVVVIVVVITAGLGVYGGLTG